MDDFSEHNEEFKALIKSIEQKINNRDSFYLDVEEISRVSSYYLEKGMVSKAMAILKIGHGLHPISGDIKLHIAQVYTAQGDYKNALDFAEQTLELEPNNDEVIVLKAEIHSYLGEHQKAIDFYLEFLEKGTPEAIDLVYNDIAWEYESLVDYENALKYFKLALDKNPEEDTLLFEIAYFYEELNKQEECIEFYNRFLDENPYSYNGWYNLGIVYNDIKNFKKAVFAFDYATIIKEDFVSAYFNKGNAHFNLKEYGDALECYYKTFEYEDSQPVTFCYIGECYEKLLNYKEAEKSYEIALSMNSDLQEALIGMAIVHDKQGRTIESLPFIEKAIRLFPKNSSCWYIAGEVYNKLERYDEAYLAYAKADEFDTDDNSQIQLDFSNFIAENLSLQEAVDYLQDKESIACQFRLVAYFLMLNEHKKAIHQFQQCLTVEYEGYKALFEYHEELNDLPEFISMLNNFN
ncbi:MAG: tetratricopeptide repeat protein [Flavobacteriales bacterium]